MVFTKILNDAPQHLSDVDFKERGEREWWFVSAGNWVGGPQKNSECNTDTCLRSVLVASPCELLHVLCEQRPCCKVASLD